MPTLQNLKKKLRGIRTTQKVSKAMKTASTVKYSRISSIYMGYAVYEEQCSRLYSMYESNFKRQFVTENSDANECLIVIASNKGMCGGFNSDILSFAENIINSADRPYSIFLCGRQAKIYFDDKKIKYAKSFVFSDIPEYGEVKDLFDCIYRSMKSGEISDVKIVYPEFVNMLNQQPVLCGLFPDNDRKETENNDFLFIPDHCSVTENTVHKIISSLIYKKVLETALGAQAATLMTMRSAYDTATDYCAEIEGEINRKRQSQVTSDIIETSAEHSQNGEENANV